jgi:hypothetical protein
MKALSGSRPLIRVPLGSTCRDLRAICIRS